MDSIGHHLRRDLASYTAIDVSLIHEDQFGVDMADFFSCDIYNSLDISSATDAKYDSSSCLEAGSNAPLFLSEGPNISDWPVQSEPPNDEIRRAQGGLLHKKRMLNDCGTFSTIITPQPKENKKQKLRKRSEEKEEIRKAKLEDAAMGVVHVRARRGQATDSHSLAERVRRKRLSERMKILQALVPGCDMIKGKQQALDEIINYVKSIQKQIEFLSMKLVYVSELLHFFAINLDDYSINQQFQQHIVDEKEIMRSQPHPPSLPIPLWETDALLPSTSGIHHRVTNNYQMMEDPELFSSLLTDQGQYCSMSQD